MKKMLPLSFSSLNGLIKCQQDIYFSDRNLTEMKRTLRQERVVEDDIQGSKLKYSSEMLFYFVSYPKEASNERQSKKNRLVYIGKPTFPPLDAQEALFKIQMDCFSQID